MADIQIYKVDETTLKLLSNDHGILMEINEHFTFYVDGYKFMPLFRNKMWDGKCRLYNSKMSTLPYGLLFDVLKFANSHSYSYELHPSITERDVPTSQSLLDYAKSLHITGGGTRITPRDYQLDAYVHACTEGRSLVISPTGSGKSLIIYLCVRWFLEHYDQKVLIVVPTTSLVEQMTKDFADYSQHDSSFDVESEVHKIYSGKEKHDISSRVIITTWQSAITLQKSWFQSYGMVIGDEAHLFKAKSLNTIMSACVNACYRIGTTGTLDGSVCNERVLIGNFGPTHRVITTKELIDNDTLAALKIKCIVCNHADELKKVISKADYQTEIDAIATHVGRNTFIANLALDQKGNTLVLFNLVQKHGKPLFELISSINSNPDRHIFYVSGEVDATDRERIRELTDKHTNQTILRFGKKKIKINNDSMVNLSNGTTKFAKDVTIDDDICDKWISAWV